MTKTAIFLVSFFLMASQSFVARAGEKYSMMESCKAECPDAKSNDDVHKCMKGVVKQKNADRDFKKSECFHALKEHEKHEKSPGHKH